MAQEEVKIFFKVEGLDGYITDLDELQDALKGVAKDTEEVAENTSEIGKSGGKAKSFFSLCWVRSCSPWVQTLS